MTDLVLVEDRGPVRHLVLNRAGKRNAFNAALVEAVGGALDDAAKAESVRVVVLRGDGPMFSSGMDVGSLADLSEQPERLRPFRQGIINAFELAETMAKPTICQIHGACIGGAMELALACDLRVMAADAIMGLPETRVGLIPDVGGSSRLPSIIGLGRAKEMILTGKFVDGTEAERIGLVNRVAPADDLEAATEQLAGELLACAPIAVGLAKRVMDAAAKPALSTTLELEVMAQQICAATDDFAEGTAAFKEKRQPEFSGR